MLKLFSLHQKTYDKRSHFYDYFVLTTIENDVVVIADYPLKIEAPHVRSHFWSHIFSTLINPAIL